MTDDERIRAEEQLLRAQDPMQRYIESTAGTELEFADETIKQVAEFRHHVQAMFTETGPNPIARRQHAMWVVVYAPEVAERWARLVNRAIDFAHNDFSAFRLPTA